MGNLIEHAKREFKALGYKPVEECEDDPNKWIQESVLELIEVFAKQGHSGSSAPFCVNFFEKLASFKPLSPIKCTDDEWFKTGCKNCYQNKRLTSVFKDGKKGFPYYIDAIVWRNQKGMTYTGSAQLNGKEISSRQFIRLPFTPKTFYVDVIEKEIKKDDFEFHVKDRHQLKAVEEYYDFGFEK